MDQLKFVYNIKLGAIA